MKNITKRKDGRYSIRKTIKGITYSYYAKTAEQAKKILSRIKNNKAEIKEKQINLQTWIEDWLENYKKPFINQKSYNLIKNTLKQIQKELGKINIKFLTTEQIQKCLNKKINNRTKERIELYLNACLQKAEDLSIIDKNPFKAVQKSKKGKYKNYSYNYEEQIKIIDIIKGTAIEHEIMTYLMTGCRPNELPPKENFNFENNIVIINGTKNKNAQYREIEISNEYSQYMQKYFLNNDMQSLKTIRTMFKELCKKINLQNTLIYRLRHTFATNHFTLGTQTKRVSQWLGHSSINITLDTYTDIDKTANKDKIKRLYNNFYYIP